MKRLYRYFIVAAVAVLLCLPASAQRLIPGQWNLAVGGGVAPAFSDAQKHLPAFGEVSFNKVNYGSKMVLRLTGLGDHWTYTSAANAKQEVEALDIDAITCDTYLSWGYLWSLARSRSRAANLWGGVTVDVGARTRTYADGAPWNEGRLPGIGVLMGFSPEFNFEFFAVPSVSMSLFFRPHFQWVTRAAQYAGDTQEKWFYPYCGAQLNFYFFVGK